MIIFKKVSDVREYVESLKKNGAGKVGFVPTMGALHKGHVSLIERAKEENDVVIASIFVNPTQFNDKKDFEKYPVSIEDDIELLVKAGCHMLFTPPVDEMYPGGTLSADTYDFGFFDTILEGANRPGHFKGVGQIVAKLVSIVEPDKLYLGQKDYQQCMVITQLIQMMGLGKDVEIKICPTVREPDGLAMSSRNRRLTEPQRAVAGLIYQCLVSIQAKQGASPFQVVQKECFDILKAKGFEPEYVVLASAEGLVPMDDYDAQTKMVALIAARIGDIRLIDNLMLN